MEIFLMTMEKNFFLQYTLICKPNYKLLNKYYYIEFVGNLNFREKFSLFLEKVRTRHTDWIYTNYKVHAFFLGKLSKNATLFFFCYFCLFIKKFRI